ncbi:hypothetical protein GYB22_07125 [bacterium]|nr:hypothetical protein [bacterium]
MEPQILMIGRKIEVLNILKEELKVFHRKVTIATGRDEIMEILENNPPDFVVIGAGLPDDQRISMENFIQKLKPDLPVFPIERSESTCPFDMIGFTNRMAVEWKAGKAQ